MSSTAQKYLYKRFSLNGKMLEVRRVEDGARPEVTIRWVNENNELSANEFSLTLRFLLAYGKPLRPVGDAI